MPPYDGPIVTRAQAKAAGLPRYFNGNPCPQGHVVERVTANGTCRLCSNGMARKAHAKRDPERKLAQGRAWKAANPDIVLASSRAFSAKNREYYRAYGKQYREAHPETWRAYYEANADVIKQRARDWDAANPVRRQVHGRNRRARERAAEGTHTAAEIAALYKAQRGRCVYCRASLARGYHADHITPLILGGSNRIGNIQLTCSTCNLRKNRTAPDVFARRMGLLI